MFRNAWPGLIALAMLCAPPASAQQSQLPVQLDAILGDTRLQGVEVSVSVRSAASGSEVYSHNGDIHLPAASNQKLITTTTALAELGPEYRFRTTVLSATAPTNGLVGDLYLRGTGDPTLTADRFDALAEAVAAAGVREVHGSLVADDTWFDAERLGFDWSQQDEQFAYAAPISALSVAPDADFNTGSVQIDIAPGPGVGTPASVSLTPNTSVLQVHNSVLTGPPDSARQLVATRNQGTSDLYVEGRLPADSRASHPLRSVADPTAYAVDVFQRALVRRGVLIRGSVQRGATPADAVELAATESMPLKDVLTPLLKLSNNPMSEILVKATGRHATGEGTWPAGLSVARTYLAAYGVDPSAVQLVDGSGLSTADLIAPKDLTQLLVGVQGEPWFATWYMALPIAGEPEHLVGGTLSDRMQDTSAAGNVHAKSGSLTTTSALSGYVTSPAGDRLAFSVVLNGVIGAPATEIEDAVAVALADWSQPLQ